MSKIKPETSLSDPSIQDRGYFLVQHENGKLTCSCGGELIKLDEYSYKCSGGYPIFRPEDGDIIQDKFGNKYLRMKPHKDKKNPKNKGAEPTEVDEILRTQHISRRRTDKATKQRLKDMEQGRRSSTDEDDEDD